MTNLLNKSRFVGRAFHTFMRNPELRKDLTTLNAYCQELYLGMIPEDINLLFLELVRKYRSPENIVYELNSNKKIADLERKKLSLGVFDTILKLKSTL